MANGRARRGTRFAGQIRERARSTSPGARRPARSALQRRARGRAMALDLVELALGAGDEVVEVDRRGARRAPVAEGPPQQQLAVDPELDRLELDEGRQRRPAHDPAVELVSPGLLG